MLKALADRLAEAFAEWLHRHGAPRAVGLRAGRGSLDNAALIREEYRGHPSRRRAIRRVPTTR